MSYDPAAIAATVSVETKEKLRELAHKNKRSLAMEIAWVLEQHVKKQEESSDRD